MAFKRMTAQPSVEDVERDRLELESRTKALITERTDKINILVSVG